MAKPAYAAIFGYALLLSLDVSLHMGDNIITKKKLLQIRYIIIIWNEKGMKWKDRDLYSARFHFEVLSGA